MVCGRMRLLVANAPLQGINVTVDLDMGVSVINAGADLDMGVSVINVGADLRHRRIRPVAKLLTLHSIIVMP